MKRMLFRIFLWVLSFTFEGTFFSAHGMDNDEQNTSSSSVSKPPRFELRNGEEITQLVNKAEAGDKKALNEILERVHWGLLMNNLFSLEWLSSLTQEDLADRRWFTILANFPNILLQFPNVLADMKTKATQGSAVDQFYLGVLCGHEDRQGYGEDLSYNPQKAIAYLLKAADQNYVLAMVQCLSLISYVPSLRQFNVKLRIFHTTLVKEYRNCALVQQYLGNLLLEKGKKKQAESLFYKAAMQGDLSSQRSLCDMYKRGDGVRKYPLTALSWYWMSRNMFSGKYDDYPMFAPFEDIFERTDKPIDAHNPLWEPENWKKEMDATIEILAGTIWMKQRLHQENLGYEEGQLAIPSLRRDYAIIKNWLDDTQLLIPLLFKVNHHFTTILIFKNNVNTMASPHDPPTCLIKSYIFPLRTSGHGCFLTIGYSGVEFCDRFESVIADHRINIVRNSVMNVVAVHKKALEEQQAKVMVAQEEINALKSLRESHPNQDLINKEVKSAQLPLRVATKTCERLQGLYDESLNEQKAIGYIVTLFQEYLYDGEAARNKEFAQSPVGQAILAKIGLGKPNAGLYPSGDQSDDDDSGEGADTDEDNDGDAGTDDDAEG